MAGHTTCTRELILNGAVDCLSVNCPVCGHRGIVTYWSSRLPPTCQILCYQCGRYRLVRFDPTRRLIDPDLEEYIDRAEANTHSVGIRQQQQQAA